MSIEICGVAAVGFDWWARLSARDPRIAPNRKCSAARISRPSVAPLLSLGCQMVNFIAGLHGFFNSKIRLNVDSHGVHGMFREQNMMSHHHDSFRMDER